MQVLILPCENVTKCILHCLDTKNKLLSSFGGHHIASNIDHDFQYMYDLPNPKQYMDSHLYVITNYLSTKYVILNWVKDPTKFF